jgi:protein SCO1/2
MERVRILCSVYDPLTGKYRTNYSLYFQFAGFLTFVGFMIYLSINFWNGRPGKTRRRRTRAII